jgi:hypothetical protein
MKATIKIRSQFHKVNLAPKAHKTVKDYSRKSKWGNKLEN